MDEFQHKIQLYIEESKKLLNECQSKNNKMKFWGRNHEFSIAREVLLRASSSISHEVTKFSLTCTNSKKNDEITSVCAALLSPCEQLHSAVKVSIFTGTGIALTNDIINHTSAIFGSLNELVSELISNQNSNRLPELTGRIWDNCKSLVAIPESNYIAIKRKMLETLGIVKDMIPELEDMINKNNEESIETIHEEIALQVDSYENFNCLTYENEELSESEKKVVLIIVDILKMFQAIISKAIIKVSTKINHVNEEILQENMLTWTSQIFKKVKTISDIFVNLGAELYPPHDSKQMIQLIDQIKTSGYEWLEMIRSFPDNSQHDVSEIENGIDAFSKKINEANLLFR